MEIGETDSDGVFEIFANGDESSGSDGGLDGRQQET